VLTDRHATALAAASLLAGASAAWAGGVEVTVLDGALQRPGGVKDASVSLEGTGLSGTTDLYGKASIGSVSSGRYVMRVTGPSGFTPVRLIVDVAATGTTTVIPLLLPRVPTGATVQVGTTAGVVDATMQVESSLVPNARLTVTSGTTLTGTSEDPRIGMFPVDRSLTPSPFIPGVLEPARLYAVSPGGLGFSTGQSIRFPNDDELPAGTSVEVFALLPKTTELGTGWASIGTATVTGSGAYLESEGAFVTSATYFAMNSPTPLPTTYRVTVQDRLGNAVSGATVQVHRLLLTETATAGVYEGQDVVATGSPVRALVSKDFGSGMVLHALTDPTFVDGELAVLHGGQPLKLELVADGGVPIAGSLVRNATAVGGYTVTEVVVTHHGGDGEGDAGTTNPQYTLWDGLLPQTFFPSVAPVVSFSASPTGTSGSPDTDAQLPFTVLITDIAFDPDSSDPYTTTARVTSATFSLDGGSTWQDARLLPASDLRGARPAPPGGSRYELLWDLWSIPAPTGVTGSAQQVRLRVAVLDAPSGNITVADAPTFYYRWPSAAVARTTPQHGATGVFLDDEVLVDFVHDMTSATITGSTITLASDVGTLTTATVTYLSATRQAKLTFAGDLPTTKTLTLTVTTGAQNAFGLGLSVAHVTTFTTGSVRGLADDDNDGLLNVEELAYGTGTNDDDSDNDGWKDGDELFVHGTSPTEDDTDGDGTDDDADSTPLGSPASPLAVADAAPVATFLVTHIAPVGSSVSTDAYLSVTFNNAVDPTSVVTGTNLTLTLSGSPVSIEVVDQPNPKTLRLRRTGGTPLAASSTYVFSALSGGSAVEDTAGTPLNATASATFRTGSTSAEFEATHYLETLAMTRWERFPLTAPTASGREGVALAIPSTRKLLLVETDVVTPGRGLDVAITRVYRNNETATVNSGCFGNHWHFAYDRKFEAVADQAADADSHIELRHRTADGRVFDYLSDGGSTFPNDYENPPGFHDEFRQITVGEPAPIGSVTYLVQRNLDGTKHFYRFYRGTTAVNPSALQAGDVGYLMKVVDRNLNTTTIARHAPSDADRPNRIDTITDDLGRVTTFEYSSTAGKKDLVVKIEQFSALDSADRRSWLYSYDSNRNLTRVETPPSSFKNESGTLLTNTRKQRDYTYTTSGSYYELSSVVDGRGSTSMRFVYDGNHDVRQIDYGSGADAGTAIFAWSVTSGVTKATQVDRNGNVLTLEHEVVTGGTQQTISSATTPTSGLHPGEPAQHKTLFGHLPSSALALCTFPFGNQLRIVRDVACGCDCPKQYVLGINATPSASDVVVELGHEEAFHRTIRITEPRGNNSSIIGGTWTAENVFTGASRIFASFDKRLRDAYTTWIYHDHEDVEFRSQNEDPFAFGEAAPLPAPWFQGAGVHMPSSYGDDPNADDPDLHKPLGGVFGLDDFDKPVRGGNPVAVRGPRPFPIDPATCLKSSTRQAIEAFASYNQYGQRAFAVEPDQTQKTLSTQSWNRSQFYTSGAMKGYLEKIEVDTNWRDTDGGFDVSEGKPTSGSPALSNRLALSTTLEYDDFGNVTKVTNGRGNAWQTEYDLLNLVTRTIAPTPFLYERTFTYDGNNNLIDLAVQNVEPFDLDDDGLQDDNTEQREVAAHPDFTHHYVYTTANMLQREEQDAWDGSANTLVTRYQYDRKQLLVGIRMPEGNSHWTRYDERDLVCQTIQGASDPGSSETTRFDYNLNGLLEKTYDDDGDSIATVTSYDGLDRPITWTDELGNKAEVEYDEASHVRRRKVTGQASSRSDAATTLLEHTLTRYDEAGRAYQVARELWGTNANEQLGSGGLSLTGRLTPADAETALNSGEMTYTLLAYDEDSNLIHRCDDNDHERAWAYDAADRLALETDHLGSTRAFTYDAASNLIRLTEVDKRSDTGATDGTFYTESFFDALDQPVATVTNLGNTHRALYDSRSNVVEASDAMGLTGGIDIDDLPSAGEHGTFPQGALGVNARGNTTRLIFDGLSRLIRTERDLRQDGTGGSVVVGQIVTQTAYDDNGRVVNRVDPSGNFTAYAYDHQDRPIRELYADGTSRRFTWNRVDTLEVEVDARGLAKSYTYDAAERRQSCAITGLPPGAGQTTSQAWDYDGLGRRTVGEDNDSRVESAYDSMSRLVAETQRIETGTPHTAAGQSFAGGISKQVKRAYDGVGNLIKQTYPSGVSFERRYDEVDRLETLEDGFDTLADEDDMIGKFVHAGMGTRRMTRDYWAGGGSAAMRQAFEFDGDRRVISLENYVVSGSTRIRGFGYTWDRANNRRYERRLSGSIGDELTGTGDAYRYDSDYRLVHDDQDVADSSLDGITANAVTAPAMPYVANLASDYVLDAAGNRRQTTIQGTTKTYSLDASGQTGDLAMNQYSAVGSAVRQHDLMGNLTASSDTGRQAFFDADNRLVQWTEGSKDVRYRYDVDGRRTMKEDVGSSSFSRTLFFYDGWQEIEETNGSGTWTKRFLYGEGIDEVLRAEFNSGATTLYYHQNSLGSVVAVTNAAGAVQESYRYDAYGKPTIRGPDSGGVPGSVLTTTAVGNPFMFTGRRWDYEEASGWYFYRYRQYDPVAGRFVSRDPLGVWGDPAQLGSGQQYCGANPVNRVDPLGDKFVVVTDGLTDLEARNFRDEVDEALQNIERDLEARLDQAERELEAAFDERERREQILERRCPRGWPERPSRSQRNAKRDYDAASDAFEDAAEAWRKAREALDRFRQTRDSDREVRIRPRHDDEAKRTNSYGPQTFNRDGSVNSPGTIAWNPANRHGGDAENDSDLRDPYIGLGHEISHANDDIIRGEPEDVRHGPPSDGDVDRWKNRTEERATQFENEIRRGARARTGDNVPADRTSYTPH
jgi:RHS repeat-associated protein